MSDVLFPIQLHEINFLSNNCRLKGWLHFKGVVRIAALLEGDIFIEEGILVLERDGRIQGEVTGEHIEIYGQVEGKITASERVILWPSAIVTGPIQAKNLVVYPGAILNIDGQIDGQSYP